MPAHSVSTDIRKVESLLNNQNAVGYPDMCPVHFSGEKKTTVFYKLRG
jgi:hypothetical protein